MPNTVYATNTIGTVYNSGVTTNVNTPGNTNSFTQTDFLETLLRKSFLENGEPSTVFMQLWEEPVSQRGYKSVTWPRLNPMKTPLSEAELTEGVIPDGHDNVVTTVTAEPKLLGDYTKITDVLDMETLLDIIARQGVELSHNAKRIIDEYIQSKLNSDTNIPEINAGDVADPSDLTAADVMSFDLVLNAITYLTSQGVTNERFKVVMHPNNFRDFCKDSATNTWINKVIYDNFKWIQDGYVTSIENFDIYLSANIKPIVMNEGDEDEFNLYPSYALRKGAYGISSLSSLQTYYKPFGSAGIADPLNQLATIGWKAYFGCEVLNPFFIVRLNSRASTDYEWQKAIS